MTDGFFVCEHTQTCASRGAAGCVIPVAVQTGIQFRKKRVITLAKSFLNLHLV